VAARERKVYRLFLFWDNPQMPTYAYQASGDEGCEQCTTPFERRQKIEDPRLEACPACGSPVRRVISPPNLASGGPNMSEDNLEKHGFTQYRKAGKGKYEKTVGKGPDFLSDKDD
jgi:putative FmdB family regulatory protein